MRNGRQGWHNESGRHSLAARGIRTRVHLPPREETRLRYSFDGAYGVRRLRQEIERSAFSKPEYDGLTTPSGQARFLRDTFGEIKEQMGLEIDLEKGGLSYIYTSDPPNIVVNIYDEEWYDSKVDNVDPWDFTVMTSALLNIVIENSFREELSEEYRESGSRQGRWDISLKDLK